MQIARATDVKIDTTGVTGVPKSNPVPGSDLSGGITCEAAHGEMTVGQSRSLCQVLDAGRPQGPLGLAPGDIVAEAKLPSVTGLGGRRDASSAGGKSMKGAESPP